MALYRDRSKVTSVQAMKVSLIFLSGVLQIGDVKKVENTFHTFVAGGSRGAASFITRARHLHSRTRLGFTEQEDRQVVDFQMTDDQFYQQMLKEIEDASSD